MFVTCWSHTDYISIINFNCILFLSVDPVIIQSFTITPPIAQRGRTVTLKCLVSIAADLGVITKIALLDDQATKPVTTKDFHGTGEKSINYETTVDANSTKSYSTKSYKCGIINFLHDFEDWALTANLTIADRGACIYLQC